MKFLVNLLLVPALLGVSNISKNDNNKKDKTNDVAQVISNNVSKGNKITVDLNPEPYYKKDNFVTSFQYTGELRVVDYWFKCENIKTNWNDKYLFERGRIDVEVICCEKVGSFTLYMMNEEKDVSEISVFTRLTEYGVFATTGSQKVCDNKVLEYEYNIGVLKDEEVKRIFNSDIVLEGGGGTPVNYLTGANEGETGFDVEFTWEDKFGKLHPCSGIHLKVYNDSEDFFNEKDEILSGYLNENGCYTFSLPNSAINNGNVSLVLLSETENTSVFSFDRKDINYTYTLNFNVSTGYINPIYHNFSYVSEEGKAMQIISGLYWAEKYVDTYDGNGADIVTVQYPADGCYELSHRVYLTEDAFEMPDVFLHEYGHTIEEKLKLFDFVHILDYTSPDGHNFWTDYTLTRDKGAALRRNFTESLATVFAFMIERKYYSEYFKNVFKADDTYYDDLSWNLYQRYDPNYHYDNTNFETLDEYSEGADAYELSTGAVLFDLYDTGSNESWDKVGLGDSAFWDILKTYQPKTLSDFVLALYDKQSVNSENLGVLFSHYGLTVRNVKQTFNQYNVPRISWRHSGNAYEKKSKTMSDKYTLIFYNANNEKLFEKNGLDGLNYTLKDYEWARILEEPGIFYKVEIGAISDRGSFETGPYFTNKQIFIKSMTSYRGFLTNSLSYSMPEGITTTDNIAFSTGNFVSNVSWKSASLIDNRIICLSPSLSNDHKSFITFHTSSTFKSVTFDLVFRTNRSSKENTSIEVHKFMDGFCYEAAEIDPNELGMDANDENAYRTYTISMGGDADGFRIYVTGYGYTALCVTNIYFEVN